MKTILLIFVLLTFGHIHAQSTEVFNAYNYYSNSEFAKAKKSIDLATTNDSTSDESKTWYYRGLIYLEITFQLQAGTENDYGMTAGDAAKTATHSFNKALSYENLNFDVTNAREKYLMCSNLLFQEGVEAYNDSNYVVAADLFQETTEVQKNNGITDSLAIYNTALAYNKLGAADEAIEWYGRCIEMGYQRLNSTFAKANLELLLKDTPSAILTLDKGLYHFPYEPSLIRMKIGIFETLGRKAAAIALLDEALQHNDDAILHFVKGQMIQMESPLKAIEHYELALKKEPDFLEAMYNVGALYFNAALDQLDLNEDADVTPLLEKALKNLETLNELAPGDETVEYYIQVIKERL